MAKVADPRQPGWFLATLLGTWMAFRRFTPVFLVFVLLRVAVLHRSSVGWDMIAVLLGGVLAGCFVYAALRGLRAKTLGYLFTWAVSGATAAEAVVLLAYVRWDSDPYGGDALLLREPTFWLFWALVGGITGAFYGLIIREVFSAPSASDGPDGSQ